MKNNDYLRRLQLTELEILKEIDRLCKKNSIRYYLIGGTLLGAIRHKGFIPWDDDIDIALPREDFDLFCKICRNELSNKYWLRNFDSDSNFWLIYSKVEKKHTTFVEQHFEKISPKPGIFIDVFALDSVCSENGLCKRLNTLIIKYLSTEIHQRQSHTLDMRNNKAKCYFLPVRILSTSFLFKLTRTLQTLFTKSHYKSHYINYGSQYSGLKETYPIEVFGDPLDVEFEGYNFYAPHDYKFVLNRVFGPTYMQLPEIKKRITHSPVEITFE